MVHVASFALWLALICTVYTLLASVIGLRTQRAVWIKSATNALNAVAGLLSLAVFLLVYFLLRRDFQLEYVASYTDITLAPWYVISALWAGQRGSLLFWTWLLALCSALCLWFARKKRYPGIKSILRTLPAECRPPLPDTFGVEFPGLTIIFALLLGFFLTVLSVKSNPFILLTSPPLNGAGLNPLLQNPYMVLHPPALFLGYAGFVAPFALAFVILWTGQWRPEWLRWMRGWVLFSWFFLGIGILLGAHWAYLELGWGGYWAWDPVENSSLLPWLTSTALLHTLMLQQRKGLLMRWNLAMCLVTFALCVFGTFVTRSGILASVHAYVQSPTGIYFLVFLLLIGIGGGGLLCLRWRTFQAPRTQNRPLWSKENSLLLTNQLLIGLGFAVLYGTLYPLFSEALTGRKILLDRSFFDTVSVPVGLVLLGLLGLCQVVPGLAATGWDVWRKVRLPLLSLPVAMGVLWLLGLQKFGAVLTCSLGVMVLLGVLSKPKTWGRPATWFHLGLMLICVGIAVSSSYKRELEVELAPGDAVELGEFRLQYRRMGMYEDAQKGGVFAEVDIFRGAQHLGTVSPEKRFYGDPSDLQTTTEVGFYASLTRHVYLVLEGWDEQQRATFFCLSHPMILWIWIGGLGFMPFGLLLLLLRTLRRVTRNLHKSSRL